MTGSEKAAAIAARKASGPPVTMLTAYDYPTARLFDEAGVDALLVGTGRRPPTEEEQARLGELASKVPLYLG